MIEYNFMHCFELLLGLLGMIAMVLMAFGIMLGMVKPADSVKHGGTILGIIIVLIAAPCMLLSAWSAIPVWQQIAMLAIGLCIWQWRRPRRQSRK